MFYAFSYAHIAIFLHFQFNPVRLFGWQRCGFHMHLYIRLNADIKYIRVAYTTNVILIAGNMGFKTSVNDIPT